MNITVLGATGKTGSALVDQALEQGHHITALVRDAGKVSRIHPALTVITGDVRDAGDLDKALVGADAVISTLGTMSAKDDLIDRTARALTVTAGERRVVLMSSFLASDRFEPGLMGRVVGAMMKGVLADKTAGERTLIASGLDWTIVYPTSLDKAPQGRPVRIIEAPDTVSTANGIARADVARFLLAEATGSRHSRQKVVITGK